MLGIIMMLELRVRLTFFLNTPPQEEELGLQPIFDVTSLHLSSLYSSLKFLLLLHPNSTYQTGPIGTLAEAAEKKEQKMKHPGNEDKGEKTKTMLWHCQYSYHCQRLYSLLIKLIFVGLSFDNYASKFLGASSLCN